MSETIVTKCSLQPSVTNNNCLKMANESITVYTTIKMRQAILFGRILRKEAMKSIMATGKIRGRLREMFLDGLK